MLPNQLLLLYTAKNIPAPASKSLLNRTGTHEFNSSYRCDEPLKANVYLTNRCKRYARAVGNYVVTQTYNSVFSPERHPRDYLVQHIIIYEQRK